MRIAHNLMAINLTNQLKKTNKSKSLSMEKLSSGLKINRASDDAAGLSISQKMKTQIIGLQKAEENIQSGISLAQIADGGLGQIQDQLQRMRELGVQASNGTLTDDDRDSIKQEINQIKIGIDNIANTTEFNTIKLLNGTNPHPGTGTTVPSNYNYENVLSLPTPNGTGNLDLKSNLGYPTTSDDNGKILVYGSGTTSWPSVLIGGANYYLNSGMPSPTGTNLAILSDSIQGDAYVTKFGITNAITGVDVEVTQSISIIKDKYNIQYNIKNNSPSSQSIGFEFNLDTDVANDDGVKFQVNNTYLNTDIMYSGGSVPDSFKLYNENGASNKIESQGILKGEGIIEDPTAFAVGAWGTGVQTDSWVPTGNNLDDSSYSIWWQERTVNSSESFSVNTMYGLTVPPTVENPDTSNGGPYSLMLQVGSGSTADDIFKVELSDARTQELFPEGTALTSGEDARKLIGYIDKAIEKVSHERAKYGAYQNSLEHIHSNVSGYVGNLTSADSGIEDADMAKEILDSNKNDILTQIAQSLLVQANQQSYKVLDLLNK